MKLGISFKCNRILTALEQLKDFMVDLLFISLAHCMQELLAK